ncbi:MAG TPA: acetate--CoA ligase family protein [Spirochaetota bacterium]|nr:acetate--CoA ligase family protein [Spirochaetota bacterium]
MTTNPLHKLMNPASIVIIGAGNSFMKMGTMHALSIIKDGYLGKFYPVHPRDETVLGHKAYRSVEELPEAPDLALIVIPSKHVIPIIDSLGKLGTRHAIIITAGFKETGEKGGNMERELVETAHRHGMRFVGPNCMGIVNTAISLNTTVVELRDKPGLLGFASQSGTYITQSLKYLGKRGIRFSKALSVGNEADISIIDALEYLGEDEQTKAIALYIEGIRDVPRFIDVARRITPKKPVVAQYVGGSKAGARSGKSHTGAMAGPDHIYDGIFRQAGVIRVDSVEDLYGHGWALATQPILRGNRVGVVTNSGGPGTAMSHVCEGGGMEIPVFSEKLRQSIRPMVPPHAPCGNPVDITFSLDTNSLTTEIPRLAMESGEVDGIVLHGAMSSGFVKAMYPHIADMLGGKTIDDVVKSLSADLTQSVGLPQKYGIPMLLSSFFDRDDSFTEFYEDNDIPVFDSPEKTARAMVTLNRYRLVRQREAHAAAAAVPRSDSAAAIIEKARRAGRSALDEHEAKLVLAAYGAPVTDERLVTTAKDAAAAAETLGYPAVLKACSPEILHKTEKGLVRLNLISAAAVAAAFDDMQKAAGAAVPAIVYRMVEGSRELVAGMTRHAGIGPCVMFGLGGVYTELLRDIAFRVAPLTAADAREMMHEIKGSRILGEFRGMPAADIDALSKLLLALGAVALNHPEVREIDINPILISGARPVAVDALVTLEA